MILMTLLWMIPQSGQARLFQKDSNSTSGRPLSQIKEQIIETTRTLQQDKKVLDAHQKQLSVIEKQLNDLNRNISQRQHHLYGVEHKLSLLNQQRQRLNGQLQQQQYKLAEQIKTTYMQGPQPALKLLLNVQNAEHLSRLLKYYDYIYQSRLNAIQESRNTIAHLDENQSQIMLESQNLLTAKQSLLQQQQNLQAKLSDRQQWVEKIQDKLKSKTLELDKLRDDARALETVVTQQKHQPQQFISGSVAFNKLKGRLPWPIQGNVEHRFGEKIQNDLQWKGVVINSPAGTRVVSPAAGRVVFADWMRGFGLLMIIDHGQGFLTLYGRNQVLYKQPGDAVTSGEAVGLVGMSGGFAKSGLYFEIRQNGSPVDPEKWFQTEKA